MELNADGASDKSSGSNDFDKNGANYRTLAVRDPLEKLDENIEDRESCGGDGHATGPSHTTGYLETLTHHFKSNVGPGIFALGDAFKNAGLLLAPPLTIFFGLICVHAQHILLNCNNEVARRLGKDSTITRGYAETVELCFSTGPLALRKFSVIMRRLVTFFLCATQLGFCSVSFVFISSNMQQVFKAWDIELDLSRRLLVVLLPILLSATIRNLKFLVPLSSLANVLIISGYVATIYVISQDLPPISERRFVSDWKMFPMFFGTVIYSFEGINLVLPLKNEMKNPRNFDKPLGVLNVGMVIVGTMFIVLGFLAYFKYGDEVKGSVTLNLESKTNILPQFIKIAILLSLILSYALQLYVLFVITWPTVKNGFFFYPWPLASEITFRIMLCIFTFILAEAVPHLDLIISLVGAVSSTALALIFPPIIEIVVRWQNATLDKTTILKDVFILLIGLLGCIAGTYESVMQIILKAFSNNS